MVLNPAPGGEETTSQLPQAMPSAEPRSVAVRGLNGAGDAALEAAKSAAEPEPTIEIGVSGDDNSVSEPMVRRIEAPSTARRRSQADKLMDALSSMPRAPALDLGIELAVPVAPDDGTANEPSVRASDGASGDATPPSDEASQEAMVTPEEGEDVASSQPEPSLQGQALSGEPRLPSLRARSSREAQRPAPGIEPLASALDAAVRLAADASVAAEALEKLKVLLQHKQQLEGLRSTQPVLAQLSPPAEPSAGEAQAIAQPVLPPLPLPVPAAHASLGRTRLPLLPPPRAFFERRGLDVRGFMAGFALSWAFGVVLYFYMTAG